jgi:hypothetical protein
MKMLLAGRYSADVLKREAKSAHASLAYSLLNPTSAVAWTVFSVNIYCCMRP